MSWLQHMMKEHTATFVGKPRLLFVCDLSSGAVAQHITACICVCFVFPFVRLASFLSHLFFHICCCFFPPRSFYFVTKFCLSTSANTKPEILFFFAASDCEKKTHKFKILGNVPTSHECKCRLGDVFDDIGNFHYKASLLFIFPSECETTVKLLSMK